MLFSAAFFYLFISFWAGFFSYHIQFLFFFSLNLEAAKLPIILLFLFFFPYNVSNIWCFSGIQSTWISGINEY